MYLIKRNVFYQIRIKLMQLHISISIGKVFDWFDFSVQPEFISAICVHIYWNKLLEKVDK